MEVSRTLHLAFDADLNSKFRAVAENPRDYISVEQLMAQTPCVRCGEPIGVDGYYTEDIQLCAADNLVHQQRAYNYVRALVNLDYSDADARRNKTNRTRNSEYVAAFEEQYGLGDTSSGFPDNISVETLMEEAICEYPGCYEIVGEEGVCLDGFCLCKDHKAFSALQD